MLRLAEVVEPKLTAYAPARLKVRSSAAPGNWLGFQFVLTAAVSLSAGGGGRSAAPEHAQARSAPITAMPNRAFMLTPREQRSCQANCALL